MLGVCSICGEHGYIGRNGKHMACYQKEYHKTNPKYKAYAIKFRQENKDKYKEWYKTNYSKRVHKYIEACLKRRELLHTLPGDEVKVKEIYRKARELGLTVDHMVPLQGKNVCGLHVSWNMEMIPLPDNISKGNRFNG
jgi:hypothetical protein